MSLTRTLEHEYRPVGTFAIAGAGRRTLYECFRLHDGSQVESPRYWTRTATRDRERAARETRANLADWRPYGDWLPGE